MPRAVQVIWSHPKSRHFLCFWSFWPSEGTSDWFGSCRLNSCSCFSVAAVFSLQMQRKSSMHWLGVFMLYWIPVASLNSMNKLWQVPCILSVLYLKCCSCSNLPSYLYVYYCLLVHLLRYLWTTFVITSYAVCSVHDSEWAGCNITISAHHAVWGIRQFLLSVG